MTPMPVADLSAIQQALWQAIQDNDPAAARDAMALGAHIRAPRSLAGGVLPIHWASRQDTSDLLRLLVGAGLCGPDLDERDAYGRTPLHFASQAPLGDEWLRLVLPEPQLHGDHPVFLLLSLGASPHIHNKDGDTPLHIAAGANSMLAAEALLAAGASPLARNLRGETPLDRAVAMGRAAMRHFLSAAIEDAELRASTPSPSDAPLLPPRRI